MAHYLKSPLYKTSRMFIQLTLITLLLGLAGCAHTPNQKVYRIGLSQCSLDDAWRRTMLRELQVEFTPHDSIELIVKAAQNDSTLQKKQIQELIDAHVDVLIISPLAAAPLTAIAEKAYQSDIPTIITDRKINSDQYSTFIGADNYAIGREAGKYIAEIAPPNATLLEVWGLRSSSPAQERHQGFIDAIKTRKDLHYRQMDGDWIYEVAQKNVNNLERLDNVDIVYSQNDMMAIAVRKRLNQIHALDKKRPIVVGVDATPGAGLDAVAEGAINVSFLYPTGANEIAQTTLALLRGDSVAKKIVLSSGIVDARMARGLLSQAQQMMRYQHRIHNQLVKSNKLKKNFAFLENAAWTITLSFIVIASLFIYVFIINRKIRKYNTALQLQNKREEQQNKKLIALNAEIEQVTAQKLQFFTNISHEIRTPLSLIIGPLDRLIREEHRAGILQDLQLMHKNAGRLMKVINQLLDFRRIENDKQEVNIEETNIIEFVGEVKSYFERMAQLQHIKLDFYHDMPATTIWIDRDMIEKVLVNLLSNALKFTDEGGQISLYIEQDEEYVIVRVVDTGCGISTEDQANLFDRFYSRAASSSNSTGIGLHLAKEYMEMHHGDITVDSTLHKGTTMTLRFHRDRTKIQGDHVHEISLSTRSYVETVLNDDMEQKLLSKEYQYTLLIVDDDEDMRQFLDSELSTNFRTITASDGFEALEIIQKGEENISLVLSDVMMPRLNGYELCQHIKEDINTSDIPVILLTALSDVRQQIYGVAGGAEGFVRKPFHINYLKIKIIRLLEARAQFRKKIEAKIEAGDTHTLTSTLSEDMQHPFLADFLAQLDLVYKDAEYNIERLSTDMGLSRGHLHRKIKEITGHTPVEMLRNYRLGKARDLLHTGRYNINEAAYECGFASPAYFSKCFKAYYHMKPTEYLEQRNTPTI